MQQVLRLEIILQNTKNTVRTPADYCYGGAGADAAYLGTENGKVKFMQSGVVGLVDQSKSGC